MNHPFNPSLNSAFNASTDQDSCPDAWSSPGVGRPKVISDDYLARLQELATHSPRQYGYTFDRWTAQWLRRHLSKEFGVDISDRHVNRLLCRMGLSSRQRRRQARKQAYQPSGLRINTLDPTTLDPTPLAPISVLPLSQ